MTQETSEITARTAPLTEDEKQDPMQWLQYYWSQQIDDDPNPFLAMSSLMRTHQLMTSAIDTKLKKEFELSLTDYLMLKTLQLSDTGTRLLSRVAWHLLVHATTVTIATDRLENRGLLNRHAHPKDRRATYVTITDEGRRLVDTATAGLRDISYGLPGLDPVTAKALVDLLAPIRKAAGDLDRAH
ncbi:MarR family winged helix-turn-helix transcriptional regulator [Rhodococcus opacus]|uniref:MarR family transcriptional regulator n=1 Tax=Rhodococcus opacus TaxID=37919 RepID=A0A076F5I3_RHOOP|nr:MarR family winged helix-turn-helix transcriptional regulator [Rhodococcus opacus]AII10929.1 MarR family transcriptional regulator [Rhodococcus opacus]